MMTRLIQLVTAGMLFVGLSSCASLQQPERVTQPQPLGAAQVPPSSAGQAGEAPKAPASVGPGGKGEELFVSKTEMSPRPEPGPVVEEESERPVERNGQLFSLAAQGVDIKTVLLALSRCVLSTNSCCPLWWSSSTTQEAMRMLPAEGCLEPGTPGAKLSQNVPASSWVKRLLR